MRFPPAELLNSNSIQLWNSLCVAGHEGLGGGIEMIALLSAEAEETGQQGTVAPSVHTPHYYKER